MTLEDVDASPAVIAGVLPILYLLQVYSLYANWMLKYLCYSLQVYSLYAIHCRCYLFFYLFCVCIKLNLSSCLLWPIMAVSTAVDDIILADKVYTSCVTVIEGREILSRFDFTRNPRIRSKLSHQAQSFPKDGDLPYLRGSFYSVCSNHMPTFPHILSAIRANWLLSEDFQGFLTYVTGGSELKRSPIGLWLSGSVPWWFTRFTSRARSWVLYWCCS